MSTVVYQDGFNLIIRSREKNHKYLPHCHAVGKGGEARITLETFQVLSNSGFSQRDIRKIIEAVRYHQAELLAKWEEYHGEES